MGAGKTAMVRNSSYSGAQQEKTGGLNSAMLANLNKQNNKVKIERRKSGIGADDEIENALDLRASRGEIPMAATPKQNFESDETKAKIANGKLPLEESKQTNTAPNITRK